MKAKAESTRKKLQLYNEKFIGHVDFGTQSENVGPPKAKEAIEFLFNCVNDHWKLPVGYFFIDSLSGSQKSNLVHTCLKLLYEAGVTVCSLTFDSAAFNIAMVMFLGVHLATNCLVPYFKDPVS